MNIIDPDEAAAEDEAVARRAAARASKLLPNGEDQPLPLEGLPPEAPQVDLVAERDRLQLENIELLNRMAQAGHETDPPLLILQMKMRLDMLHSLVIGSNDQLSTVFEHAYEQRLNGLLNDIVKDAARRELLKGVR